MTVLLYNRGTTPSGEFAINNPEAPAPLAKQIQASFPDRVVRVSCAGLECTVEVVPDLTPAETEQVNNIVSLHKTATGFNLDTVTPPVTLGVYAEAELPDPATVAEGPFSGLAVVEPAGGGAPILVFATPSGWLRADGVPFG